MFYRSDEKSPEWAARFTYLVCGGRYAERLTFEFKKCEDHNGEVFICFGDQLVAEVWVVAVWEGICSSSVKIEQLTVYGDSECTYYDHFVGGTFALDLYVEKLDKQSKEGK